MLTQHIENQARDRLTKRGRICTGKVTNHLDKRGRICTGKVSNHLAKRGRICTGKVTDHLAATGDFGNGSKFDFCWGNTPKVEGGVAGVLGGSMIFRGASVKSETGFVEQNGKLVQKCGFRFHRHPSEQGQIFDLSSEIEVLGVRSEVSRSLFGTFRGAPRKSEATFVNHLSILLHK